METPRMTPAGLLFSQGFGTRRECRALVLSDRFSLDGAVVDDPDVRVETVHARTRFAVDGREWTFFEKVIAALNKPAGYECSARPSGHLPVTSLLPPELVRRGVQPVGRLDADTTGLLLLTDDGGLSHRLTHPKKHVLKTYEVRCRWPVTGEFCQRLLSGMELKGDGLVRASRAEPAGEYLLRLEITSGKYHQVKRMAAAAGNRVEELKRTAFGALRLPEGLAEGEWFFLDGPEAILGCAGGEGCLSD